MKVQLNFIQYRKDTLDQIYRITLALSHEMSILAEKYEAFISAFTYASHGFIELELNGNKVQAKSKWDLRYEAYDRLVNIMSVHEERKTNILSFNLLEQINNSVTVSGEQFSYKFGKRIIEEAIKYLSDHFTRSFRLPSNWMFNRYSLS